MSAYEVINAKLRAANGSIFFKCPACERVHGLRVTTGGDDWTYNCNADAPTFRPSLQVLYNHWVPPATPENPHPGPQTRVDARCHSYITDGRIEYLGDCTHVMVGQTVAIPDWDSA